MNAPAYRLDRPYKVSAWWLAAAVLAIAAMLSALIPPMQSPDEPAHLGRAYLLSHGQMLLDHGANGRGGYVDDGLLSFMDIFFRIGVRGKMASVLADGVLPYLHWTGTASHAGYTGTAYYFPAIYMPQAIALAIGEHAGLSVPATYQLVRFAVFATSAALIVWSALLAAPSYLALGLIMTPMVVFQAISSTIDALSLAICMLVVGCFFTLLRGERPASERLLFSVMCLGIFVLASSRAQALPILLLPLTLAGVRKSRGWLCAALIVIAAALAWTLFALLTVHDDRVPRAIGTAQILKYYGLHPAEFIRVLVGTLRARWDFYIGSFVGNLGYLNVPLPRDYRLIALSLLAIMALCSLRSWRTSTAEVMGRTVLVFAAVSSSLLVFVAMLATWTPFPNQIIEGVQGRYFHIPALLLAYALAGDSVARHGMRDAIGSAALGLFVVASMAVTTTALLQRYWAHAGVDEATGSVRTIEKLPMQMLAGNVLTGRIQVPGGRHIYSVGLDLGTYFGRANGRLDVEVCTNECRQGSIDVGRARDNETAYTGFNRPLPVSPGVQVQVKIAMSHDASRPAVLWATRDTSPLTDVVLEGKPLDIFPIVTLGVQ